MMWISLALNILIASGIQAANNDEKCIREVTEDFDPKFHIKINATANNILNLNAIYEGNILTIFYETGNQNEPFNYIQSTNMNNFNNKDTPKLNLPPDAQIKAVIYDDGNQAKFASNNNNGSSTGTLIAIYQERSTSLQNAAFSTDSGNSWKTKCRNSTCYNIPLSNSVSINWNNNTGQWMGEDTQSNIYFSPNLLNWTLLQNKTTPSYMQHEELFPIALKNGNSSATKWVIIDGIYYYSPLTYYIVEFGETGFVQKNLTSYTLDYVPDLRSISIAEDGDQVKSEKILVGSLSTSNYDSSSSIPIDWKNILLTPRKVTLQQFSDRMYLVQTPLKDSVTQATGSHRYQNVDIFPGCNHFACFHSVTYNIVAEIHLNTATRVGFVVRRSLSQGTEIGYDTSRGYYADRRNSGFPVGANIDQQYYYSTLYSSNYRVSNGIVQFTILVDVSVIEAFCDDGKVVFSLLIFSNPDSNALEIFSNGGNAIASNLELYLFDE